MLYRLKEYLLADISQIVVRSCCVYTVFYGSGLFSQLSPASNELALQTNFRYDSRNYF